MFLRSKTSEAAPLLILLVKVFGVTTLTCHPTEYQIGKECCPLCPSGNRVKTHCTEFRSTSCLPCLNDTYMNLPNGLNKCFSCTTCGPDSGLKTNTSCTATMDSLCEPLEGFYCIDRIENHCAAAEKHKQCQPGQYIKHRGTALTDSQCSDCSEGTFSDGTRTSCQPHTQCESQNLQLLQPGTTSTDAECGNSSLKKTTVAIIVTVFVAVLVAGFLVAWFLRKKPLAGKRSEGTLQPRGKTTRSETGKMMDGLQQESPMASCTATLEPNGWLDAARPADRQDDGGPGDTTEKIQLLLRYS